ncbi:TRAP transporter large permease [Marinobacter sp.]|uniref:TRAP transporter large permease n=1 Tax=Marinobacter sp. TaxID=50741 RepID=UPI003A902186
MYISVVFTLLFAMLLVIIGVPVASSFGLGALAIGHSNEIDIVGPFSTMFSKINSPTLVALPLFIYMGFLMERSGLGGRIIDFASSLVGRVKGGLGVVVVFSCAIFGAVSGAGSAAVASIGSVIIPRAVKLGYPREYMVALVSSSSVLTLLIPPSIPLLILALTMQVSIAGAFLTTILPGIVLAVGYSALNLKICKGFPISQGGADQEGGNKPGYWREVSASAKKSYLIMLMPLIVLGSIYGGIASPTEAASFGVVYIALLAFFAYRTMDFECFYNATVGAGKLIGALIFMIASLLFLSQILIYQGAPFDLADFVSGEMELWQGLLFINIILLLIGMIMDDISGSIIAASILYPVASELGVDPFHFVAIVGVNLGLGNITPPVAPLLFLTSGVAGNVPMNRYAGHLFKFIAFVHIPVLLLVTYIPTFSLYFPSLLGFR